MINKLSFLVYLLGICLFSCPRSALAYIYFLPDYGGKEISSVIHSSSLQEQCRKNGYSITSCPSGQSPSGACPYAGGYYEKCLPNGEECLKNGYSTSCPDGYVPDMSQYCSYDHSYVKCVCDDCDGYEYTYEQATSNGYVVDGDGCQSCVQMYYKRKVNPCEGYDYDESNCGVTSCGTLSGATCQSGTTVKYKECKACPTPSCADNEWNLDTYWCNGALKCLLPEK